MTWTCPAGSAKPTWTAWCPCKSGRRHITKLSFCTPCRKISKTPPASTKSVYPSGNECTKFWPPSDSWRPVTNPGCTSRRRIATGAKTGSMTSHWTRAKTGDWWCRWAVWDTRIRVPGSWCWSRRWTWRWVSWTRCTKRSSLPRNWSMWPSFGLMPVDRATLSRRHWWRCCFCFWTKIAVIWRGPSRNIVLRRRKIGILWWQVIISFSSNYVWYLNGNWRFCQDCKINVNIDHFLAAIDISVLFSIFLLVRYNK